MKTFEQQMVVAKNNLDALKDNINTWSIQRCIDQLKIDWKPKMKTLDGIPYDGPDTVDEPYDILYWDVMNAKWTNRAAAFKSYLFSFVSQFI